MWIYQRLRFFGWILLGLVVVFLLIVPTAFSFLVPLTGYSRTLFRWMQPIEFFQKVLIHVLTMAWMFFLGGCLASFLNVVAWRVPRGESILGYSHCPICGNRLAFRDNMPFVGWLRNSGRCRHCGASISVRYLIAEMVLGAIFVVLGSVVFLSGAANWPIEKVLQPAGFEHLLFSPDWDVVKVLVWHLTLACFLFTFALIEFDGFPVPKSIAVAGLSVVCVVAVVWPEIWLVLWRQPMLLWQAEELSRLDQVLNPVLGGGVGLAVGWVNRWATASSSGRRLVQVVGVILVGAFLGWQAVLAIGSITLCVWLCCHLLLPRLARERLVTPAGCLLLATVVHLLLWSRFYS